MLKEVMLLMQLENITVLYSFIYSSFIFLLAVELDGKPMNVSLAPTPVQRSRSENDGLFVSTGGSGRRIVYYNI